MILHIFPDQFAHLPPSSKGTQTVETQRAELIDSTATTRMFDDLRADLRDLRLA